MRRSFIILAALLNGPRALVTLPPTRNIGGGCAAGAIAVCSAASVTTIRLGNVGAAAGPRRWRTRARAPTMGVPKFFRWLTERFPQINRRISEGRRADDYVDNFYLDMNGIIHTCTHGDGIPAGAQPSEEEMIEKIFEYTERLINIAKPRKLCYLAIDGVAPRAKMNQQRSRRYRAPRDAAQLAAQQAAQGFAPPSGPTFDSNCITPGTEFLCALGERYKSWIEQKQATDPAWRDGPTVVFSGAEVVGEGEHKIMQAIRDGRASGAFPEDTRHCMYGLDADLIMLSCVSHAPHFSLLRERQKFQKGRYAPRGGKKRMGETHHRASGIADGDDVAARQSDDRDFVFLEIELLRGLLAASMRPPAPQGGADTSDDVYLAERLVDDFVFICMLVGNDFLPGLPSLDVADGALNLMLRTYTELLPTIGYLTEKETLRLGAFETYIGRLAGMEAQVFEKKRNRASGGSGGRYDRRRQRAAPPPGAYASADAYASDPTLYRKEYYLQKVGLHPRDADGRRQLVQSYIEGLAWCLAYYHKGCASWDWYYPDFYGPLASDLVDLEALRLELQLGAPFPPLAQLLSVLPPQSAALVPPAYRELMLSPTSPVFDAYPADFALDLNGKRAEWEAIALLPFIDEQRLLAAVRAIDESGALTEAEKARNVLGDDLYYQPSGQVTDGHGVGAEAPAR